ncbi:DUF2306 domain-containing protein [Massilia sp. W12]|uniref:DUF2306 domain-containing protein n=1 Tax=Massilia sp. W12 TaxID=3126507 RepID=UPI0030CCCD08
MSTVITSAPVLYKMAPLAQRAMTCALAAWGGVLIAGQLLFALYVALFYGGALLRGTPTDWNKVLPNGWTAGDPAGNLALAAHVLFAVVIMLCGIVQLLPAVRRRAPRLHRISGRIYLSLAVLASLAGLYMVATRGVIGGTAQHIGVSIAGLLIVLFAAQALRYVRRGDIGAHRRYAMRLFMVVSAVWFYRVGLMFWIAVNRGPAGFDPKTFTGPFLDFLAFAQFLLPLAVLELYFRVQNSSAGARLGFAALLLLLTAAMAVGVAMAMMGMWLPRL